MDGHAKGGGALSAWALGSVFFFDKKTCICWLCLLVLTAPQRRRHGITYHISWDRRAYGGLGIVWSPSFHSKTSRNGWYKRIGWGAGLLVVVLLNQLSRSPQVVKQLPQENQKELLEKIQSVNHVTLSIGCGFFLPFFHAS